MTGNYFCVRHKNSRKHNQHFKLLCFKLNSHFGTSISACRKLNFLPIKSICLVVSSLEIQRWLIQTKVQVYVFTHFYFVIVPHFPLKMDFPWKTQNLFTSIHFWFSNALSVPFPARNRHCKIAELQPIQSDNHLF